MFNTTAFDLWRDEQQAGRLITLCSQLDIRLGGGIASGKITEFCGGPGTGKTQFCLQLCLTVQFPSEFGGINGRAIFIDTNQDFSPDRLKVLAEHQSKRIQRLLQNSSSKEKLYDTHHFLENISYIYCDDYKKLLANLLLFKNTLKTSDSNVKLIVIDSYSNLIRNINKGVAEDTRISYSILTVLQEIANEFQIAIVITNELTTHFNLNNWSIRPALGNIHFHKINCRIIMSKLPQNNHFCAFIAKSSVSPKADVIIQIRESGLRCLQS